MSDKWKFVWNPDGTLWVRVDTTKAFSPIMEAIVEVPKDFVDEKEETRRLRMHRDALLQVVDAK